VAASAYCVSLPDRRCADAARAGQFGAFRDIASAFGADANHVVMVKASYWFNR
jgi:hypothetical protein